MARVSYIEPAHAASAARAVLGFRFVDGDAVGRTPNFAKVMAHVPWLHRWLVPLGMAIQREGTCTTDLRTRELVILKTSLLNTCEYCVRHNAPLGLAAGLTAEQIAALDGDYRSATCFDDRDKVVIEWAELVTRDEAHGHPDVFARLRSRFSEAEIVELTVTAAHRNMINRINNALSIDVEDPALPAHTSRVVTSERLARYATEVLAVPQPEIAREQGH